MIAAGVVALAIAGTFVVRARLSSTASGPVMLAVLPFENQGPASDDYFGDGLADAITNRLASVPTLGVIAQRSASQYKHSTKPLSQIGHELGVQYVLQGTVRWQAAANGERKAQVSPSLIRVSDGTVRWAADPYVITPADVFTVQSEIASRVASALDIAFSRTTASSSSERPTANPAAYDAYLRGVAYQAEYFKDAFDSKMAGLAVQQFRQAIHLDTTFALAEARLAMVEAYQVWSTVGDSGLAARAKQSVDRAIELSPNLADGYLARGMLVQVANTDVEGARAALRHALDLRPGDAMILGTLGDALASWGDSTGLPMLSRSVELDPLNAANLQSAMNDFAQFRHFDEADRFAKQWSGLASDNPDPVAWRATYAIARGDTAEAMRLLNAAERLATKPTTFMIEAYGELSQGTQRLSALTLHTMLARTTLDTLFYYIEKGYAAHRLKQADVAHAYADSLRALARSIRSVPGVLGVQWTHGTAELVAWLTGNREEFAREADATIAALARFGDRNGALSSWTCITASNYAGIGDVAHAISYGKQCLTLPSGQTTWNLRLHPEWQGILGDPKVKAFLNEAGGH
jgi:TolB-like protein/tetratricopeptide (TPR) repeat protein